MNKFLLLILFVSCTQSSLIAQTTLSKTIISNGVTRSYRIYIPAIYNSSNAVPLVFNFHGYGSNNLQQEAYGDFRPIADTANFIIVHPQGLSNAWNNFGLIGSSPDDIGFISNLIDTVKSLYNINLNRVYSTGLSNGGFMSYDLACLLSSRFAAIASVAGSMTAIHLNACNPLHPLPVMQVHANTDAVVSYTGTSGIIASTHIDSLVKYWVLKNNCNPIPNIINIPDIVTTDNCNVEHYIYSGGDKGSTVELYKIINGGHTWPGAAFAGSSGNTNMDINASKEIWRFFSQYSLDNLGAPASVQSTELLSFNIFPNPNQGHFNLQFNEELFEANLTIRNIYGNIVSHKNNISGKNFNIDMPSNKNGIYFLELNHNKQIYRTKFITIK